MLAKVYACAVIGLEGQIVEVEVDQANRGPAMVTRYQQATTKTNFSAFKRPILRRCLSGMPFSRFRYILLENLD
jgi:hypothetical protein